MHPHIILSSHIGHGFSSTNLPIHILLPPIPLCPPTLSRSTRLTHLLLQPPIALLLHLALLVRHPAHFALTNTLPIPDILRRLGSSLSCLLCCGFGLLVNRSLGGAKLAAGFVVRDGVVVFRFVPIAQGPIGICLKRLLEGIVLLTVSARRPSLFA